MQSYILAVKPLEITSPSAGKDADCHLLPSQPLKWEAQLMKNSSVLRWVDSLLPRLGLGVTPRKQVQTPQLPTLDLRAECFLIPWGNWRREGYWVLIL